MNEIRLVVLDVDGTLTDGKLYFDQHGNEMKSFDVKDGMAISQALKHELEIIFLTNRMPSIARIRAQELGVREVYHAVDDKEKLLDEILHKKGLTFSQIAYIGDDLNDLSIMKKAGFPACPNDAAKEVKEAARFISRFNGGNGAVREILEYLLEKQGKWNQIVKSIEKSEESATCIRARQIFDIEINELQKVRDKIGKELDQAIKLIVNADGKVVIIGIGKSGIIGRKIASTLASTGTYAVFMNAAEGLHGDLGMIHPSDVVIAISNSGNSDEILNLLPTIKKLGVRLIAMTGNIRSKLAEAADLVIDVGVEREACPLNLAPTSSTTAALVMGDALAILLMEHKNFQPEHFALYHPGGSLGRKLLTKVEDVMQKNIASVEEDAEIDKIIIELTKKKLGAVCVVDQGKIKGIITEGDIRRALFHKDRFFQLRAKDIMTRNVVTITKEKQAIEALALMENRESQISVLPVIESGNVVGMVRIHDLLHVK